MSYIPNKLIIFDQTLLAHNRSSYVNIELSEGKIVVNDPVTLLSVSYNLTDKKALQSANYLFREIFITIPQQFQIFYIMPKMSIKYCCDHINNVCVYNIAKSQILGYEKLDTLRRFASDVIMEIKKYE